MLVVRRFRILDFGFRICWFASATAPALEILRHAGYVLVMPIYEFHCEKCERDSEILVRSNDWKGTACPHCGATRLSKKFSTFASTGSGSSPTAPRSNGGGGGCGGCCGGGPHRH
jgi:putative FmdB family regulatory protein